MKTPHKLLPDRSTLTARLASAFNGAAEGARPLRVLRRRRPRFMSTFPNEIVTCRLPNGRKRCVFVKYQVGAGHASFGHRGDVPYEAEVYAGPLRGKFPWLAGLAGLGDAWFAPLLGATPTVIHGEFYAKTVLLRKQDLFMIDWESAAVAAGEIDLATLTEGKGWPPALV